MEVSESGYPTGSIDVSKLDEIDAQDDDAKAAVEAIKARVAEGQEQTQADADRLADAAEAQDATGQTEVARDSRDVQGKPAGFDEKAQDTPEQPSQPEGQPAEGGQPPAADQPQSDQPKPSKRIR